MLDFIKIVIAEQKLYGFYHNNLQCEFMVSTSKNGAGCVKNSFCTPLGLHKVRAKIGANLPMYAVFKARRFTGQILSINKMTNQIAQNNQQDLVLTRILWLSGLERGINQGGNVDTFRRFIYIHGTNDEQNIGVNNSHGCIRMKNIDIKELFAITALNCPVLITQT